MFLIDENIKKLIISKSKELGFVKTGFASVEILKEESELLSTWLKMGYNADMRWIERGFDKRKDINLIMKDAKTVISLAHNYYTPYTHKEYLPKISRYAWGKDYHKILKQKLRDLCKFIESNLYYEAQSAEEGTPWVIPKINAKKIGMTQRVPASLRLKSEFSIKTISYVDDGPVMDKVWAKKAGIGWQGKHTNIINQDYGSWIFLCEIITNLECDAYDKPIEDLCGNCRICVNACPTGAIIDNYQLDSNLCISYQTIENKEDIPDYLELHGWIFGCDICQDVCPYNKNDNPTSDSSFYPKQEIFNKSKEDLEKITESEFNKIFSDSPIKRTKYNGWKRNLNKILLSSP